MHGSKRIIGSAGPTSISLNFIQFLSFISLFTNLHGWFVEERVCVFGPKEIQMVEIVVRHPVTEIVVRHSVIEIVVRHSVIQIVVQHSVTDSFV